MFKFLLNRNFKIKHLILFLVALLFGICHMLSPVFAPLGGHELNIYRLPVGLAIFLFAVITLLYATNWYQLKQSNKTEKKFSNVILFFSVFFLIFLVGIFWLIIYYPGVGNVDSAAIIKSNGIKGKYIATQHPWFYCFIIQSLVKIVHFFGGDYGTAFAAEGIIQILIAAAVSGHCLVWLNKKGIAKLSLLLIASVYIFCPILNLYFVSLFKDVPFSYMLLEWAMLLYDFWESKGESLEKNSTFVSMVILLFLSLIRNNGIYISALILLSMLILIRRKWRKIASLILVLFVVVTGSRMVETYNSITHLFKETVGIPLYQISATVYQGGEISKEQAEFIEKIIPIDYIKNHYNPYTLDTWKWSKEMDNVFLNNNKSEFIKVWAEMLRPNLKIYVSSYLQGTYGFWSTSNNIRNLERHSTIIASGHEPWFAGQNIPVKAILSEEKQVKIETLTYNATESLSEGQLFWLFMMILMALCLIKEKGIWIVAVPVLAGWLTIMIATPVAFAWRYILFIPLTLPWLVGLLMLPKNNFNIKVGDIN